jgi:hypothetical protein
MAARLSILSPHDSATVIAARVFQCAAVEQRKPRGVPRLITLNVNGHTHDIDADPQMPLLWAVRDLLQLTGTKFGCAMALCGASPCTPSAARFAPA